MNNVTTNYLILIYKHHYSLHLKSPSTTEMDNFIPSTWSAPIQHMDLQNNATFDVTGKNTSHPHPSGTIHPHITTQTHTSQTYPTHPTVPTFQSPKTTARPQYVAETITERKPGYHVYSSTNNTSTNHISPSHSHKSGASSNVCGLTVIFIPLISLITKVIF